MKKTIVLVLILAFGMTMDVAKANFIVGAPTNLGETVNSSAHDFGPCISADGLELYFSSRRSGGLGIYDLWVATRETTDDEWSMPVNLGSTVNSSGVDVGPNISADGLSLYFSSTRDGGYNDSEDIYVSTRTTTEEPWGEPVNLGSIVNGPDADAEPSISGDGLSLYFHSMRDDGYGITDIYVTTRASKYDEWETPVNLGSTINSSDWDWAPEVQIDGLSLIFGSDRPGGFGDYDIYVSKRPTKDNPWGEPFNLGSAVNTPDQEARPSISADGRVLYFYSNRSGGIGGYDIWQASIEPLVDLNGDGLVDADDLCIMIDHWGTDNQLCDIGPMPWGDGVVDVEDLFVIAKPLFKVYPWAETVDVNEADNGGQVEVEQGKLLVVTLESNPSTGYRWELVENNESILKQFGQVEFKSAETGDSPMVGAGAWEIFRFKAVSAGQTTLELAYSRPWEDDEPLKTFSIQVTVP